MHHTDRHLKPLERAARLYCEKIGLDADEMIPMPHPDGLAVTFGRPQWCFAAEKLNDLNAMLVSLREAATAPQQVEMKLEH